MTDPDSQAADRARALIGRRIAGKMEIRAHLGGGGMGWVFSAYHHTLGKEVAIKVLKRMGDPLHAKRFEVEARSSSRLAHPNAVSILDFGEDGPDRLVYLAMEFVEGEDLDRIIRREAPMAPRRAVAIMAQALAALSAAHESGVIHRDLKPANIMVTRRTNDDGEDEEFVKVCDFGLAKLMDPGGPGQGLTRRGMIVGTPDYMSPEQAVGDPVDGRTDVYAAGVILYEMLTGRRPFEAKDPGDVLLMHLNDVPRAPRAWVPTIPQDLERIVLWAMEKRVDQRASSARELRDALKRFLSRPDMFDLETVIDVSHLKAALERTDATAPESVTDELEVPLVDVASSDARSTPSGHDTLIDQPAAKERATPQEIPIPRATPSTPSPDETDVIAQDTWRAQPDPAAATGPEALPEGAFDYDGPHPFWLLDPTPRRIGPCSFRILQELLLAWRRAPSATEACVSPDAERWLSLARYLELTSQDALLPGEIAAPRPDAGYAGRLEELSPTALFARVAARRPTGRLFVEGPGRAAEIYLREGAPVLVRSSHPDDQTPALLVTRGLLEEEDLPGLVHTAVETETPMEQLLAAAVDLHVLRNALFKERLLPLMLLAEGRFCLDRHGGTPQGAPFAPSLTALLPNLAFRALPMEALEEALAEHLDTRLALTTHAPALLDLLEATPGQRELAARLGRACLREVLDEAPEQTQGILPVAYVLLEVGVLAAEL